MALITLTTDWQSRDYYSGMMIGRLKKLIPNAEIIRLNDSVEPFHVNQAAFLLRQVLPEFPKGTIHLFLVNQGYPPGSLPAVVQIDGQYVLGWDDGILLSVVNREPDYYIRIDRDVLERIDAKNPESIIGDGFHPSFPELSVFGRIAAFLINAEDLSDFGPNAFSPERFSPWLPVIGRDQLDGQVTFLDGYGNAITNISRSQFEKTGSGRLFEITIKSNHYRIRTLQATYLESEPGELIALFNSSGLLEIAIIHGNAAELIGVEAGTPVKIKFHDSQ